MHNYYLYSVLKQRTFWCVVKQHMKIRVKSEDIDLHTLSVLKQHTCFYSVTLYYNSFFYTQFTVHARYFHRNQSFIRFQK